MCFYFYILQLLNCNPSFLLNPSSCGFIANSVINVQLHDSALSERNRQSDKYEVLQLTLQFASVCKFPFNQERVTSTKAIHVSTWVSQHEKPLETNPLWIQRKTNILLQLSQCVLKQTEVSLLGIFLLCTAQNRHPWVPKSWKSQGKPYCSLPSVLFQEGIKAHEEQTSRTRAYTGMMADNEPQMRLVERKAPLKLENNKKEKRNEMHVTGTAEAQIQHTATSLQRVPHP